jgi:hypothetical protein
MFVPFFADGRFKGFASILTTVVNCLLGLIYLGSTAAFNAFTGCGTSRFFCSTHYEADVREVALTAAYNLPIFMNVSYPESLKRLMIVQMLAGRKHTNGAVWSLGKFGWIINTVS